MSAFITGRATVRRAAVLGTAVCSVALVSACSAAKRAAHADLRPSAAAPAAAARTPAAAAARTPAAAPATPEPVAASSSSNAEGYLTAIRVAEHPAYDRVVFEFPGGVPGYTVSYVAGVTADASGQPVPLPGRAYLRIVFHPASQVRQDGTRAYAGPSTLAPLLPALLQVSNAGDFEGYLSFGVGLSGRTGFHAFTLTGPNRVVIDITHAQLPRFPGVWDITTWRRYWAAQASVEQGHQPWLLSPSSVVSAWAAGWSSNAGITRTGPDTFKVTKPGTSQVAMVTGTRPVSTGPAQIWVITHVSYTTA